MKRQLTEAYGKYPENVPPEVVTFLEVLNKAFPPRCIKAGESLAEANRYAGLAEPIQYGLDFIHSKRT